jgi:hypothetical protein
MKPGRSDCFACSRNIKHFIGCHPSAFARYIRFYLTVLPPELFRAKLRLCIVIVRTRRVCGHSASSGEGATAMVACCHRHRGRHRCQHPANYNNLPDYPERGSSLLDEGHAAYRISSLPRACVLVRWCIPGTVCKMHCWLSAAEIVLRTKDLAFVCLGLLLL